MWLSMQSMLATRVGGYIALIGVLSGVDSRLPLGLTLGRQLRLQAWSSAAAASSRT